MIAQLEFQEILDALAPMPAGTPRAPKQDLNLAAFTLGLAAALKAHCLTHALFNILTSIGRAQAIRGFATIAQVAIDLGVTFNSVHIQLHKSPHFFLIGKMANVSGGTPMNSICLTKEAIELLVSINKKAKRYASQTPTA